MSSLCFLTFLPCAACFPSVKYAVSLPTFTPLLQTHQAQACCCRLLSLLSTISHVSCHPYGDDSSNIACLIPVTAMTSAPSNTSVTLLPSEEEYKRSTHARRHLMLTDFSSVLTRDSSFQSLIGHSTALLSKEHGDYYFLPFLHQLLPSLQKVSQTFHRRFSYSCTSQSQLH